jgi:hypothetical protein
MHKYVSETSDLYKHTFVCKLQNGEKVKVELQDKYGGILPHFGGSAVFYRVDPDRQAETLLNQGVGVKTNAGIVKEYHHVDSVNYKGKDSVKEISPSLESPNPIETLFGITLWVHEEEVKNVSNEGKVIEMPIGEFVSYGNV